MHRDWILAGLMGAATLGVALYVATLPSRPPAPSQVPGPVRPLPPPPPPPPPPPGPLGDMTAAAQLRPPVNGHEAKMPGLPRISRSADWKLVFADNFNGPAVDDRIWNVERTTPDNPGYEREDYSDDADHVQIVNGVLNLRATLQPNGRYLTGMIQSRHKQAWRYGRFEARIRIPRGKGTAPQFWMMPDVDKFEPWPQCGEIDIFETIGSHPYTVEGTLHAPEWRLDRDHGLYRATTPLADAFHTYGVEWGPDGFTWYFDDQPFNRNTQPYTRPFPFNRQFFLILSLGIGGPWPGEPDATTKWPLAMEVDWVRVYQRAEDIQPYVRRPRAPGPIGMAN